MADAEEFLIIKGKRIVLPDCISSGSIIVKNEKIVGIERSLDTTFLTSKAKVKKAILYTSRYPNGAYTVSIASTVFSSKKRKKSEKTLFLQAGSNQWSKEILRDSESYFIICIVAWSPHISLRLYQIYAQDKTWWDVETFGIEMKISRLYFAIPDSEGEVSWNHGPRSIVA